MLALSIMGLGHLFYFKDVLVVVLAASVVGVGGVHSPGAGRAGARVAPSSSLERSPMTLDLKL